MVSVVRFDYAREEHGPLPRESREQRGVFLIKEPRRQRMVARAQERGDNRIACTERAHLGARYTHMVVRYGPADIGRVSVERLQISTERHTVLALAV